MAPPSHASACSFHGGEACPPPESLIYCHSSRLAPGLAGLGRSHNPYTHPRQAVLLTLIGWNDSIVARIGKGLSGMREKVEAALGKIRPSLQADGGDVELVDVTADGIVKVRLRGACAGCPMSTMTLKNGIERILKQEVAEVKSVQAV